MPKSLAIRQLLDCPEKAFWERIFASEDFNRLFEELIVDKLEISRIMLLLRDNPLSARAISESLGIEAKEVSRHLSSSSRLGLVSFDETEKRFALAS